MTELSETDINGLASKIADRLSKTIITPRWLTLRQAMAYSNIGRDRLIQMAKDKIIRGDQDKIGTNKWFFDKKSIDEYHEAFFKEGVTDDTIKRLLENSRKHR